MSDNKKVVPLPVDPVPPEEIEPGFVLRIAGQAIRFTVDAEEIVEAPVVEMPPRKD